MKRVIILTVTAFFSLFLNSQTDSGHLQDILNNLNNIKSVTYDLNQYSSAPGDTSFYFHHNDFFVKEFKNPSDTFMGRSLYYSDIADTSKIILCYDENCYARFDWELKKIEVDSFKNHPSNEGRFMHAPFFALAGGIIKYALDTKDSIKYELKDFGDSTLFRIYIYGNVWIIGDTPIIVNCNPSVKDRIFIYDIWIDNSSYLPYIITRKAPHQKVFDSVSNVSINKNDNGQFSAGMMFPKDFEIEVKKPYVPNTLDLVGENAPDWTLSDVNGKMYSLKDFDGKVLMIQFSGIGCGPCHASIPFMKELVEEYKDRDFELISIESWSKNLEGMKKYQDKNNFNYLFLASTKEMKEAYHIEMVPAFFILDKNKKIKVVINGYNKEKTKTEIKESLDKLL